MKKTLALFGLFIMILLLPVFSAACGPAPVTAALGEQFMLYVGKNTVISGEDLKIEFIGVTSDSRCPWGIECVQAGEAQCQMQISYLKSRTSLTFIQQGRDAMTTDFNGFKITFQLQPYPVYGDKINKKDYRLKVTVTR
jgi:hypothetical protein